MSLIDREGSCALQRINDIAEPRRLPPAWVVRIPLRPLRQKTSIRAPYPYSAIGYRVEVVV